MRTPVTNGTSTIATWRGISPRGLAARLFWTAWVVFCLHFSTDVAREHYPTFALGDHLTFQLDEYRGLHPDLFEKEGYGWHIGNNPGVSMFAAIPYAAFRPLTDRIVDTVRKKRARQGATEPPEYESEWPNQRKFFNQAWTRGLDVKLGLGALVTQVFFMAPVCALGVVLMFGVLRHVFRDDRTAGWLAILFAFGTPLFYRAGFLNHNMVLGLIAFAGFVYVWDPWNHSPPVRRRFLVAGLAGGLTILFDYSGVVLFTLLLLYALVKTRNSAWSAVESIRRVVWYGLGAVPPVAVLMFYQWRAFGHPIYPGQHWMPPVEWIELGYQGYGFPQFELLTALAFDHRFGLFVFTPFFLLALAAPWLVRDRRAGLPKLETWACLIFFVGLWIFFSGSNYTRLQFNTGLRYMAPIVPFLFLPAAAVLVRMSWQVAVAISLVSVGFTWCLAMYREVETPLGVLDPVVRTITEGFTLPVLETIERTGGAYGGLGAGGTSPLPALLLASIVIAWIWMPKRGNERQDN